MIGGFLCKVSLAHLAFLRCGNICTKVLGNWWPGSSPARGTGVGQASLSTADTSTQHSALSTADTSRRTRKVSVLANSGNKAKSLSPKLASLPDLEFVKKFTGPNFRVKEFYTLKTRK